MSELRTAIAEYSDDHLLSEYHRHQDQYTAEAVETMRQEIAARRLENAQPKPPDDNSESEPGKPRHFSSEDLLPFDHSFSRTDLLIAAAMLQENKVIFHVDNPTSTDTLPIQSENELRYTIRVHTDFIETAHALLDEHFVKSDQKYLLKYTGARERLQAFTFQDIHLTEKAALEELEVTFTGEERTTLLSLAERLLTEAEAVEKAQDRVLFYFDSIDPLIVRLKEPSLASLSRNDLLTLLEILQVYATDEALPASMDETIHQLLATFTGY